MTPLQKALAGKAVLERAIRIMAKEMSELEICVVSKNHSCPVYDHHPDISCGDDNCINTITAHFIKASKGGRR